MKGLTPWRGTTAPGGRLAEAVYPIGPLRRVLEMERRKHHAPEYGEVGSWKALGREIAARSDMSAEAVDRWIHRLLAGEVTSITESRADAICCALGYHLIAVYGFDEYLWALGDLGGTPGGGRGGIGAVCRRGHPLTAENNRIDPKTGRQRCRACDAAAQRRRLGAKNKRNRACPYCGARLRAVEDHRGKLRCQVCRKDVTQVARMCKRGLHEMAGENLRHNARGSPYCLQCNREQQRESRQRIRARRREEATA